MRDFLLYILHFSVLICLPCCKKYLIFSFFLSFFLSFLFPFFLSSFFYCFINFQRILTAFECRITQTCYLFPIDSSNYLCYLFYLYCLNVKCVWLLCYPSCFLCHPLRHVTTAIGNSLSLFLHPPNTPSAPLYPRPSPTARRINTTSRPL